MQESVTLTIPQSSQWSITWKRVASDRRWSFLLIAMGVFSSIIYAHPPFVPSGAIARTTLKPRRAILVAMSIGLVNQVYGYTVRQYPRSRDWLVWGLILGLGTLIVTALALLRPKFSGQSTKGMQVRPHCTVTNYLFF